MSAGDFEGVGARWKDRGSGAVITGMRRRPDITREHRAQPCPSPLAWAQALSGGVRPDPHREITAGIWVRSANEALSGRSRTAWPSSPATLRTRHTTWQELAGRATLPDGGELSPRHGGPVPNLGGGATSSGGAMHSRPSLSKVPHGDGRPPSRVGRLNTAPEPSSSLRPSSAPGRQPRSRTVAAPGPYRARAGGPAEKPGPSHVWRPPGRGGSPSAPNGPRRSRAPPRTNSGAPSIISPGFVREAKLAGDTSTGGGQANARRTGPGP